MAVTYERVQRSFAKREGLNLITISVPGAMFQGPVGKEESDKLEAYLIDFLKRRPAQLKAARRQAK